MKSDDGYSATYVVDKDTAVGPGGKLTDIKTGADVAVTATVTGTTSATGSSTWPASRTARSSHRSLK